MAEATAGSAPCPECGGRGWILVADGGAGTARECDCRRTERVPRLLSAAAIPEGYRGKKLSNFRTSDERSATAADLQRALAQSRQYVEQFLGLDGRFVPHGLLFAGPAGCGKTHLAVGVLSELIARYQVRGRFVNLTALVQELQSTFDGGSSKSREELLGPILRTDVVVLDELGAQKPSPWVTDLLYYLIDTRYAERLPTLFTTNCSMPRARQAAEREEENLDRLGDGPPNPPRSWRRRSGTAEEGLEPAAAEPQRTPLAHRIDASLISRLFEMTIRIRLDAVPDFRRLVGDRELRARPAARL